MSECTPKPTPGCTHTTNKPLTLLLYPLQHAPPFLPVTSNVWSIPRPISSRGSDSGSCAPASSSEQREEISWHLHLQVKCRHLVACWLDARLCYEKGGFGGWCRKDVRLSGNIWFFVQEINTKFECTKIESLSLCVETTACQISDKQQSAVAGRDYRAGTPIGGAVSAQGTTYQVWLKMLAWNIWKSPLGGGEASCRSSSIRSSGFFISPALCAAGGSQRRVKKSKRRRRVGRRGSRSCADRLLYVAIDARWIRGASDVNKDGESCASGVRRPLCLTSEPSMQPFFIWLYLYFYTGWKALASGSFWFFYPNPHRNLASHYRLMIPVWHEIHGG